jgi:F-type H+-transporting ATPase subunit delta
MTLSAVVSRYANALADVVTSGAGGINAETALNELNLFEATLRGSAELHNALTSPAVPPSRKRAVTGRLAGMLKLSPITRNLLFVLIDKRRIASLPEVIQSFETVADERLGFARADISSPLPLSEPQRAALTAQLERLSGKRIRARFSVDDSLIGGVVAQIGSTIYDGSVRGQLQTLHRRLTTEI